MSAGEAVAPAPGDAPPSFTRYPISFLLQNNVSIPPDFLCPLSMDIMRDPVILVSGQTYERSFIEHWLSQGNRTCPKTEEPVDAGAPLYPNLSLRRVISAWCEANGIVLPAISPQAAAAAATLSSSSPCVSRSASLSASASPSAPDRSSSNASSVGVCPIWPASPSSSPSSQNHPAATKEDLSNVALRGWTVPGRVEQAAATGQSSSPIVSYDDVQQGHPAFSYMSTFASPSQSPSRRLSTDSKAGPGMMNHGGLGSVSGGPYLPGAANAAAGATYYGQSPATPSQWSGKFAQPPASPMHSGPFDAKALMAALRASNSNTLGGGPQQGGGYGRQQQQLQATASTAEEEATQATFPSLVKDMVNGGMEERRGAAEQVRKAVKDSPRNREAFVSLPGAPESLAALLQPERVEEDPVMGEHAITAVLNLSITPSTHKALVAAGCIHAAVSLMSCTSATQSSKENAAAALFALSASSDGNKAAVGSEPSAIPLLVAMSRKDSGSSMRGRKDASLALFNLSLYDPNRTRILAAGAVPVLVGMLSEYGSGLEDKATAVLANLAKSEEGTAAIGAGGGVTPLVEALEGASARGKEDAVTTLLLLATQKELKEAIMEEGVVPTLVALGQSGTQRARVKAQKLLDMLRSKPAAPVKHRLHAGHGMPISKSIPK